ncbi:MAG: spore coat protein GerQ [Bacilli bacterium]|nr:spore coat protein GerQ [Bacilli bacterium]
MNGSYYSNPMFTENVRMPADNFSSGPTTTFPMEQSYIENILRANIGKKVSAYVSFPDSLNWKDKIFTGRVEQAGRDHLIISDPSTGKWYLILMIYLDYVEFDEKINYGL